MYTEAVRNITLSADDTLIDRARERAAREKTTLNAAFREWLATYTVAAVQSREEIRQAFAQFDHIAVGRKFTRDEMNER